VTAAGDRVQCRAYQVVSPESVHIAPSRAYLNTIVRGARAAGLPAAYIAELEAIEDRDGESGSPA
jgi:hypothetical protein